MTMRPINRTIAASALAVLAIDGHITGQQAPVPRQAERGADLLAVPVTAVLADGTAVADLKPEELTLRIGGRQRTIRSVQFIPNNTGADADDSSGLPLPFGTNAVSAAGRTLSIIIDQDSFRPGQEGPLRGAITSLIDGLGESDRISLVTIPLGGTRVPFTTDHRRVRTVLPQIVGQAPITQTGSDLACQTRRSLEALLPYFDALGVREEPVTIMFLTSALAAPRRDAASARAPGMCELSEHLFTQVAVAAGAARAQFYVIRPGDASDGGSILQREGVAGSDNPLAGTEHLAGVTGGKLLSLTGSHGSALDRVLRETVGYYLITTDAQQNDRTGRSQQLDVRTSRRGIELRSRPFITFGKPEPGTAKLLQPSLRDMLGTQALFRDLPLRAAAFPALAPEGETVRVVAMAEPVEPNVKIETLGAVLFDKDAKVAAQWLATEEELQRAPVMGAMAVPTGAYRMRVAAIDSTGRAGTVDYDVTAEVVKSGPLRISSLVLGLNRAGGFQPKLQFTTEPLAIAYLELEGAPAGARVNAALEIAQTMNGPAIVTVPLAIESTGDNKYTATGSLAVGALPPGDYIARAMVGLEGSPMTRVVRTIRKAPR